MLNHELCGLEAGGEILVSGFLDHTGACEADHAVRLGQIDVADEERMAEIEAMSKTFDAAVDDLKERFENKVEKLQRGDVVSVSHASRNQLLAWTIQEASAV